MRSQRAVRVLLVTRDRDVFARILDGAETAPVESFVELLVTVADDLPAASRQCGEADVILLDFYRPVAGHEDLQAWIAQHATVPVVALVPAADHRVRRTVILHGALACLAVEQFAPRDLWHVLESVEPANGAQTAVERAVNAESQWKREATRCDRVVQTARDVAHTLNNELSRTLGYLELIALLHRDDETRKMTEEAIAGITLAAQQIACLQKVVHQVARERAASTLESANGKL